MLDQICCLLCQNVEETKVGFGWHVGSTPVGGDHAHELSAVGDEGRCLTGVDAGLKISPLVFRIGHVFASRDFRRDRPFSGEQCDSARAFSFCAHPLPKFGSLWIEASKRQQSQFASGSALWKQHLQTGEIRVHDVNGIINNSLVQRAGGFLQAFQQRTDTLPCCPDSLGQCGIENRIGFIEWSGQSSPSEHIPVRSKVPRCMIFECRKPPLQQL